MTQKHSGRPLAYRSWDQYRVHGWSEVYRVLKQGRPQIFDHRFANINVGACHCGNAVALYTNAPFVMAFDDRRNHCKIEGSIYRHQWFVKGMCSKCRKRTSVLVLDDHLPKLSEDTLYDMYQWMVYDHDCHSAWSWMMTSLVDRDGDRGEEPVEQEGHGRPFGSALCGPVRCDMRLRRGVLSCGSRARRARACGSAGSAKFRPIMPQLGSHISDGRRM